ncbi:MAG: hypothetical protein EA383_13325 [Spirochaetaceae bacterium]|nr:MAG: hypothetical protein EA383_13325 [Spirochaetaceae bacterium]
MKKRILLIAIVALLVLTATPLVAQNNGQTLNIGGLVPLQLTIAVTPDVDAQNLDLEGLATLTPAIATFEVRTNNTAGWSLWVFSVNESLLVNSTGDDISYQIAVDDGVVVPAYATIPAVGVELWDEDDAADFDATLRIEYTQTETFPAGYYSDQLALVLRAK